MLRRFRADDELNLLNKVYSGAVSNGACSSLVQMVLFLAERGDKAADRILGGTTRHLAAMGAATIERLGRPPVHLSGGVFRAPTTRGRFEAAPTSWRARSPRSRSAALSASACAFLPRCVLPLVNESEPGALRSGATDAASFAARYGLCRGTRRSEREVAKGSPRDEPSGYGKRCKDVRTLDRGSVRVLVADDYEAMSGAAAELVAGQLREKPDSVFLVPTGTTPLGMYRRLAAMHREEGVSFARATFFNLDEYLGLPADHPASYHAYMEENFYSRVDVDTARVHVPRGAAPEPEAECERYEAAIRDAGGADLCVLGIGRNGHIGFNEPGAPLSSRTRVVRLSESTREVNAVDFEGGLAPESAITVGMTTILESRTALLLASGANKAAAVAAAIDGKVSEAVPASALRRHGRATFIIERVAAWRLTRNTGV